MTRPFQISSDAMNALESSFDVTPQAQNPLPPSGKLKTLKPIIVKTQSNANHNPLLIKCNKILEEVLAKINSMDQGMQRIEAKLELHDTLLNDNKGLCQRYVSSIKSGGKSTDFYERAYERRPENTNETQGNENTPPEERDMSDS
ncbi:hypothetical protein KQX54_009351 [Cotesia glomerata]|uniref:Uncharacterized protein n=1 Tax=Cotesia glomerata TaxID=32391 RepID=A0AAV7I539_COTGL|nr:hypothetical protein KQX54_009351 [Cotesia glomerata]